MIQTVVSEPIFEKFDPYKIKQLKILEGGLFFHAFFDTHFRGSSKMLKSTLENNVVGAIFFHVGEKVSKSGQKVVIWGPRPPEGVKMTHF